MAAKESASSTLPWNLAIEALAGFDKVDASLLMNLVKRAPCISDDMGKNAREVVSFRILETVSSKADTTTNNVESLAAPKIGFDSSKRCEDVLSSILSESSGSKRWPSEVEMAKYDIDPFVKHKRSCMPKSALELVKDLILQGNHPLLAQLKERSGLVIPREPEKNLDPNYNTDSNGVTERLEGYNGESQSNTAILDLIYLSSGNKPIKNLIPAKRGGQIEEESTGNHVVVSDECDLHLNPTKKHKHDVPVCQSSPQRTELVESQCQKNSPHKENSFPDDTIQRSPCDEDEVPRDKSGGKNNQDTGIDEAKEDDIVPQYALNADVANEVSDGKDNKNETIYNCLNNSIPNMSDKEKDNMEDKVSQGKEGKVNRKLNFMPNVSYEKKDDLMNNNDPESSSDNGGYNDEMADVDAKKHMFLSSQCTYSQDSMTEINLCVKCHKTGNLLVCGFNTCPLVVHESCLGYRPTFDEQGNFYCPFCAFSRAHSEYLALKRKFSSARKDFTAFIGSGNESQLSKSKNNQSGAYVDLNGKKEANNVTKTNVDDDVPEKEKLVQCNSDDPPRAEKCPVLKKDKMAGKKKGRDLVRPPKDDGEVDKSSTKHDVRSTTEIEGSEEEENDRSVASNYSIRSRKQEKHYTSKPSFPQLRRKKLVWTKAEEETLKEGVKRFSNDNEKWKKILEFGSDVFLKGRTTIDLKDKWRNLCKGSPRSSK